MILQETTQEFLQDFWHLSTNEVEVINTIFEKKSTVPKKDDIIVIFNKVLSKINLVDRHSDKKDTWVLKGEGLPVETVAPKKGGKEVETSTSGTNTPTQSTEAKETTGGASNTASNPGPRQQECYHLRAGHCKFGRAGDTPDAEGKTCPFLHPRRKCKAHIKAGGSTKGCRDKQCQDSHQLVCMSWKFGQECRRRDCNRLHPILPPTINRGPRYRDGPRGVPGAQNRPNGPQQTDNGRQPNPWLNNKNAENSGHPQRQAVQRQPVPVTVAIAEAPRNTQQLNQADFLDQKFRSFQREISNQISNQISTTVQQILAQHHHQLLQNNVQQGQQMQNFQQQPQQQRFHNFQQQQYVANYPKLPPQGQ